MNITVSVSLPPWVVIFWQQLGEMGRSKSKSSTTVAAPWEARLLYLALDGATKYLLSTWVVERLLTMGPKAGLAKTLHLLLSLLK